MNNIKVKCIVCKKEFEVSEAQFKLMTKIGAITCGHNCAIKWIEQE